METPCAFTIVIVAVPVAFGQAPEDVIVFLTVYVPGVLAERSTFPVDEFTNTKPAGDEVKIPAEEPDEKTGVGSSSLLQ